MTWLCWFAEGQAGAFAAIKTFLTHSGRISCMHWLTPCMPFPLCTHGRDVRRKASCTRKYFQQRWHKWLNFSVPEHNQTPCSDRKASLTWETSGYKWKKSSACNHLSRHPSCMHMQCQLALAVTTPCMPSCENGVIPIPSQTDMWHTEWCSIPYCQTRDTIILHKYGQPGLVIEHWPRIWPSNIQKDSQVLAAEQHASPPENSTEKSKYKVQQ